MTIAPHAFPFAFLFTGFFAGREAV